MKPQVQIQRTAEFSSRRRALFPCEENSDPDLGCISPLNFDSDESTLKVEQAFSLNKCVGDYDIIGLVDKSIVNNTPESTPLGCVNDKIITPSHVSELVEESPTQKLKTPHDISNNSKLPKLIRKTAIETQSSIDDDNLNSDFKSSKVRTALFPEMSLPPKTFYPNKTESDTSPCSFTKIRKSIPKKSSRKENLYLCKRKKNRSGQINAGVSHKIRKNKKIKKISKVAALQAAVNIIENSPLNSFLDPSTSLPSSPKPVKHPSPEPEFQEPDPSKKFFKSSRHKGVVTVHQNIKLEVNNGKISLMASRNGVKRPQKSLEEFSAKKPRLTASLDFDNENVDILLPPNEVSNIIESLEDKENFVFKAQEPVVLMSPTSQMCNMTSGLALNSPKKAKNLNTVLSTMPNISEEKRLFPVFYPGRTISQKTDNKNVNNAKKIRPVSKDQMLLDAGQKRFGVTQCPECKIIYHMGDPGDEIMHLNYHNAGHIFRFNGWKYERVVSADLAGNKIIQIVPNDPKIWWKKVKDVMDVVNRDLGFYDIEFNTMNSQIFFCIKSKVIVGALVAESKTVAHRLLTTHQDQVDLCSEESYPIKCGVSRIWVAQNYRKRGIATSLMNSLKKNFMFGHILRNEDIAFSSPTEMGKVFGKSYFNTPNFLIYFV